MGVPRFRRDRVRGRGDYVRRPIRGLAGRSGAPDVSGAPLLVARDGGPGVAAGAGIGCGRRLSAVELQLPGMPFGPRRLTTLPLTHAVVDRRQCRLPAMVLDQRVPGYSRSDRVLPRPSSA